MIVLRSGSWFLECSLAIWTFNFHSIPLALFSSVLFSPVLSHHKSSHQGSTCEIVHTAWLHHVVFVLMKGWELHSGIFIYLDPPMELVSWRHNAFLRFTASLQMLCQSRFFYHIPWLIHAGSLTVFLYLALTMTMAHERQGLMAPLVLAWC